MSKNNPAGDCMKLCWYLMNSKTHWSSILRSKFFLLTSQELLTYDRTLKKFSWQLVNLVFGRLVMVNMHISFLEW